MLATPEYEDVLKRPEQLAVSRLSLADADTALHALAALVEPVETHNTAHFRAAAAGFSVRLVRPADILHGVVGS